MLYLALIKVKVLRHRTAHQLLKFAELRVGGRSEAEFPPGEFGDLETDESNGFSGNACVDCRYVDA